MPGPEPPRDTEVYFLGAGTSSAFGLPNTPALLSELKPQVSEELLQRLAKAYEFFYPDAEYEHYQPDVVDFFSSLSAYVGVGGGWPGTGLPDARELVRTLKREIARLLIKRACQIPKSKLRDHPYLRNAVRPGTVIVTTNWDPLIERHASLRGIPLRRTRSQGQFQPNAVTLLKLHGSVDWVLSSDVRRAYATDEYAALSELSNPEGRPYRTGLPDPKTPEIVRVRTEFNEMWRRVSSRVSSPWLVTMVTGKQDELGPLAKVWRDAYAALGRASRIEVAGYSLPADDVEVRTLLRAGVMRGGTRPVLRVVDPSPPTHGRFRTLINHEIESDYAGVPRA